jgi:CTP:molybdopterin cytidylyltransferase MocA
MKAIILAGGEMPPELQAAGSNGAAADHTERALLQLDEQPIIEYVLDGLRNVEGIEAIVVVAPPRTMQWLQTHSPDTQCVPAQTTLAQNVIAGIRAAIPDATASTEVLLCTCDIPLATAETWTQFLQGARKRNLEAAYAIVRREVMDAAFPGGRRTYANLRDGTFTGGNGFILPGHAIDQLTGLIEAAHRARKNPFAIARLLGPAFLVRALTKRLSVVDIERKMSQILKCAAGAVEMQDASIAFDVDKTADYDIVRQKLADKVAR